MDAQKPNIKEAIRFIAENPKPIKTSELEKLIGKHIFAFSEPTVTGAFVGSPSVEHFFLESGTLNKIYPTFHPEVIKEIYLKNFVRTEYTEGWLGWKIKSQENIEDMSIEGCHTTYSRGIYFNGNYYSVHAGRMHGDECKYCMIVGAQANIEIYKPGDAYGTAVKSYEIKNALKKYPRKLKKFFGDKIIEELAKKNKIKLD